MKSNIDYNLLPPAVRDSLDPSLLDQAQSIEWSIDRGDGRNEHGFLGDKLAQFAPNGKANSTTVTKKTRKVEWYDSYKEGGRDSGIEYTPTSPSLGKLSQARTISSLSNQRVDLSPLDESLDQVSTQTFTSYQQARPQSQVVYERAPRAIPGQRTVHYEKATRVMSQDEVDALGLDPDSYARMMSQKAATLTRRSPNGHQRARSVSPTGARSNLDGDKSVTLFGSMEEIPSREQEFYPYRDAHQGKPLPGDNEYGTWGSRFDDAKQWKLCNGQWVRVAEPKPKVEPKPEEAEAKRIKAKEPKKMVAKQEPVRLLSPEPGNLDDDDFDPNFDLEPALDYGRGRNRSRSPTSGDNDRASLEPVSHRGRRAPLNEEPVDIDALKDKYRPKDTRSPSPYDDEQADMGVGTSPGESHDGNDTKANPQPTGVVMLEPTREPSPVKEVMKPIFVEVKRPKRNLEQEKRMEDPNLMWMRMGPAEFGPPFGSLRRRKAREEEWVGPACELCHKQIEERRCMLAENMKFHCWHFSCSFCLKTLKPADFLIAEADKKPYCLNCHKREFPEVPLANIRLDE